MRENSTRHTYLTHHSMIHKLKSIFFPEIDKMNRIKKTMFISTNKPIKPRSHARIEAYAADRQKKVEAKIITTKYQIILINTNVMCLHTEYLL